MTNNDRFQWILDAVPQWWKELEGIQVDVGATIALIPGAEPALPGDWIIRDGRGIRTESCEEGRIKARALLINMRREVAAEVFSRRRAGDKE